MARRRGLNPDLSDEERVLRVLSKTRKKRACEIGRAAQVPNAIPVLEALAGKGLVKIVEEGIPWTRSHQVYYKRA